jgi:rRNA maturation endonuclease Nob1
MPTYKHPCPHCGKYIERDVAACPFCGTADPFAPGRCPNCSATIEDLSWKACPKCGQALPTRAAAPTPASQPQTAPAVPSTVRKCTGCGAPLTEGARFCTVCGTLAP